MKLYLIRHGESETNLSGHYTGWAQVNGRDKCSIEEKVRLDREYIDKKSLAFDIKIFLKTFVNVFTMSDVVEGGKK